LALALAALGVLAGALLAYERITRGPPASRREIESIRSEISDLRRENSRLMNRVARVGDRIDAQVGGFPRPLESGASGRPPRDLPARLASRIARLKDYLAAHPDLADPEMRLLKDDDWVGPVRDIRLDTEASKRKALAQVRMQAQARLGVMVAGAARDYLDANNGQAPASAAQLAPYLADPANADLLQGFGKPDATAPPGCLFQVSSAVDEWYGSTCYVSDNEFQSRGTGPGIAVEQAIAEYQRARGAPPSDAALITPYLRDAVSPAVVSAVFEGLRPAPGAAPVISEYGGMSSMSGSADSP
jgi:hypothetical protein